MENNQNAQHPSFGFIRASRVSGHTTLFDSAVRHHHYVTVTIGRASQERRYSENQIYGKDQLVEVAMSESQFAQFITSINVGSGAPCTLTWMTGTGHIDPPPADINTRETFSNEVKEAADVVGEKLKEALTEIKSLVASGKANKGQLLTVLRSVETAMLQLNSNMPFMMQQFAEGIEKLTDRAKMDLNAHATMLGQRMTMPDQLLEWRRK